MKRVTQSDVAKAANISRSTVQRALNNSGPVDDDIKKKILEVAKNLGYKVNPAAKLLAQKRPINLYAFLVIPQHLKIHKDFELGFKKAITEYEYYNINLTVIETPADDSYIQKEELSKVIKNSAEIDGIIVKPIQSSVLNNELKQIKKLNIPIVSLDTDAGLENRNIFVGEDYYRGGRILGDLFDKIFLSGTNLVEVVTHKKFEIFHSRMNGFNDIIKNNPKIKINDVLYIDTMSDTYNNTVELISNNQNIKAIFTTTNIEAVAKALTDIQRTDIFLCGFDFDEKIKEYINNSVINLTLYQRPKLQGYIAAKKLINAVISNEITDDLIVVGFDIITKENINIYSMTD